MHNLPKCYHFIILASALSHLISNSISNVLEGCFCCCCCFFLLRKTGYVDVKKILKMKYVIAHYILETYFYSAILVLSCVGFSIL